MKNKRKRLMKIMAGIVAVVLIGGILIVTNAFVGNPISATMANKEIEKYVNQNYAYLDLEIDKVVYNFKDKTYTAKAKSKRSIDTKFDIYYRHGEIIWDDYESVVNLFNTLQRLSDEYSNVVRRIVAKDLGYENNRSWVTYEDDEFENISNVLELDMKFDRALPLDAEVMLNLNLTDYSIEEIANVFKEAHVAFTKENCTFNKYHLMVDSEETIVMVNGLTPADIESGELVTLLHEAKNKEDEGLEDGRISVYIRNIE